MQVTHFFGPCCCSNEQNVSHKKSGWYKIEYHWTRATMQNITNPQDWLQQGMTNSKEYPKVESIPEIYMVKRA